MTQEEEPNGKEVKGAGSRASKPGQTRSTQEKLAGGGRGPPPVHLAQAYGMPQNPRTPHPEEGRISEPWRGSKGAPAHRSVGLTARGSPPGTHNPQTQYLSAALAELPEAITSSALDLKEKHDIGH